MSFCIFSTGPQMALKKTNTERFINPVPSTSADRHNHTHALSIKTWHQGQVRYKSHAKQDIKCWLISSRMSIVSMAYRHTCSMARKVPASSHNTSEQTEWAIKHAAHRKHRHTSTSGRKPCNTTSGIIDKYSVGVALAFMKHCTQRSQWHSPTTGDK